MQSNPGTRDRGQGGMTYNFDPDRWLEDQQQLLEMRRRDGVLDENAYEVALRDLERRYEEMVARLDGTYQLPRRGEVS